jgi:hypothetical protein
MTTARQTLARQSFHSLCGGCGGKSRGLTPYENFFYKSPLRQQGGVKKGFQRERHSPNTTATTALSLLFLHNYLKIKN